MGSGGNTLKLKAPLKWAGGKSWLVPYLLPLWATHHQCRLVEPFCGSLAVALGFSPQAALLADINPHLINLYQWLQHGLEISIEMRYERDLYYSQRERFNALISDGQAESAEAAQLFYYLNRTGYNGLCRFNQKGGFNVPFGKYKTVKYTTDFLPYREILRNWQFQVIPFDQIDIMPDDFVYADPPYDVEFTQYAKEGFTWADQVRLAEWLAGQPCPVIASNQATERIQKLYADLGFTIQLLSAPRRINSNGDRTPALEILATKGL